MASPPEQQSAPGVFRVSLEPHQGSGSYEYFALRDGFRVGLASIKLFADDETHIHGEDDVKFHVRLCGQRDIAFDGRREFRLQGPMAALLVDREGLPKLDRIAAHVNESSLTAIIPRARLLEFLDGEGCAQPRFISPTARLHVAEHLLSARPTAAEAEIVAAMLACPFGGSLRRFFLEAKTMELICSLLARIETPGMEAARNIRLSQRDLYQLQRIRERLEREFMNPPSLGELAREAALNRNKLCTGFKALFGHPIVEFCSRLRLREANRLLHESHLTVSEIALAIGYASVSSFSAAFQNRFGYAPTAARSRLQPLSPLDRDTTR